MAGDTNRSYRTVNSNAATPSVSSGLLESGSWSNYTSLTNEVTQPSVTSTESTAIQQEWYETLHASVLEHWANVRDLFTEPSRRFLGKKLEAILRCLCLPCTVLVRTLDEPRRHFRPHIGIMYLYVYLCVTVVLNLMVVLTPLENVRTAECIHKSFVIVSMFLAIFCMWHLYRFTYRTAEFPRSRGGLFRAFYQGGIRIFGFLSLGYSVAVVIGFVKCGTDQPGVSAASEVLNVVVAATKAIFILVQIVFLHFFYEARIPEESPHVEIIVAHLFGNNLALWLWTLISEEQAREERASEISTAVLRINTSCLCSWNSCCSPPVCFMKFGKTHRLETRLCLYFNATYVSRETCPTTQPIVFQRMGLVHTVQVLPEKHQDGIIRNRVLVLLSVVALLRCS